MRAAFIIGGFSTHLHGPIEPPHKLYTERALMGSESSFFNMVRGLSERGHEITVYADVQERYVNSGALAGATMKPIGMLAKDRDRGLAMDAPLPDIYLSLNEPDYLRAVPSEKTRIVWQQFNDFSEVYCRPGFDAFVDIYAALSPVHRDHLIRIAGTTVTPSKFTWLPNSINLEFFSDKIAKVPFSMAWCSSPDRGLHRLIEIFPAIRARVPGATLKIFYRFEPWYEGVKDRTDDLGKRGRYIKDCLDRLGRNGENGLTMVGPVNNRRMAEELLATQIWAYPCDTISFTEGFCVAALDAMAARCIPIISDADAIGDIYKDIAHVIPGKPGKSKELWVETIVRAMMEPDFGAPLIDRGRAYAEKFDRKKITKMFEDFLTANLKKESGIDLRGHLAGNPIETKFEKKVPYPEITVLLGSDRPGGLDITLAGLAQQSFQDFEVVFVDGRYHRRHQAVLEAVRKSGLKQPFFHVPNHRYSDGIWGTTCAGYNTGFMLAAGRYVVMLLDYAYTDLDWLQQHIEHLRENRIVMGPCEYRRLQNVAVSGEGPVLDFINLVSIQDFAPDKLFSMILEQKARFGEISAFKNPFTPEALGDFHLEEWQEVKCRMQTGPASWEVFNTKNESFPTELVLAANGMDENYDRGSGPGDPDLGRRLVGAGNLSAWIVKATLVHCINPRKLLPNLNLALQGTPLPPPHHERWVFGRGVEYFEQQKAAGTTSAPNPYDLRDRRHEIWDWREESLHEEPVLPRIVISDEKYFR